MKFKRNRLYLAALAASVLASIPAITSSQPLQSPASSGITIYGVEGWQALVPSRRVDFQTFRTATLADPTLSPAEKTQRINQRFKSIENEVRAIRLKVYRDYERVIGVGNSATKGSGGGSPKISKAKCVAADKPDMSVSPDRVRGAYRSGGAPANANLFAIGTAISPSQLIAAGGRQICAIRLKQSGKGRKVAFTQGRFQIDPARIEALVNEEVPLIMTAITGSPI